jgi:hypothetical protein
MPYVEPWYTFLTTTQHSEFIYEFAVVRRCTYTTGDVMSYVAFRVRGATVHEYVYPPQTASTCLNPHTTRKYQLRDIALVPRLRSVPVSA